MADRPSSRSRLAWRKSGASQEGDECVEVAAHEGRVYVRDSRDSSGGMLVLEAAQWRAFLRNIKSGAAEPR
ncbi:DUF397 domain-containing protein [Actinomadura keratinilytica]|jgi:hypothetical protein|uniref:DUF397 domain-containing protein n=1 Tax=Actinomadura keratinilytica TaxID=547461 RepID=A0ABP7Y5N6_9ACTN